MSNTLKSIIETGPAGNLSEYLESMEKMDEAVQFFLKNNPESMELSILKSLNDTAKENLEKEFRLLLTRNSRPVPVVTIQVYIQVFCNTTNCLAVSFDALCIRLHLIYCY